MIANVLQELSIRQQNIWKEIESITNEYIEFWVFRDDDISIYGDAFEEYNEVVSHIKSLLSKTGGKWPDVKSKKSKRK
jgi:hypothetical protein